MAVSDGHYVALEADIRDLKRSLAQAGVLVDQRTKQMGQRIDGFTSKLALMGKALAVAFAVDFAAKIGAAFAKAASDAEETNAKFRAVFKEQSDEIDRWAREQATAFGRSQTAIKDFLAGLQDTFVPLGFARKSAAELSKGLTQLSFDLGSFYNQAESEVIGRLTSALVGNHEAVRNYGIIITEAALNQELMNMGLKLGVRQATEQHKALARLSIIMRSTSDAHGNAARESEGYANQVKVLEGRWQDFKETIGRAVLPVALQLVKGLQENLAAVKTYGSYLVRVFKPILTLVGDGFDYVKNKLYEMLPAWAKIGQADIDGMLERSVDAIERTLTPMKRWAESAAGLRKTFAAMTDEERAAAKAADERAKKSKDAYEKLLADIRKMFAGLKTGSRQSASEIAAMERRIARLRERMTDPAAWSPKIKITVEGAEHLQAVENKVKTIHKIGDAFGSAFENAIVSAATGGKLSMKDMAKSILGDLTRILTRALIIAPILRSLGMGGNTGTQASSNNNTGIFDRLGTIIANNLPKFHDGLKPREFPAILEQGEAVLSRKEVGSLARGGSMGAQPVQITNNYNIDAKNSDAGVTQRIINGIAEMERQRPGAVQQSSRHQRRFPTRRAA